jgi:general secretion pathway protein H
MIGRASRAAGFTLIELLVVIVIVGVLAGAVTFHYTGGDREVKLKTEAERLARVLDLARESAVARNEEWGLYVDERKYTFAVLDPERGEWREQKNRPFVARSLEAASLTVKVDKRALKLANAKNRPLPAVLIFSSGEQTPFEIELTPDWETRPWRVHSDGLSRTIAERA